MVDTCKRDSRSISLPKCSRLETKTQSGRRCIPRSGLGTNAAPSLRVPRSTGYKSLYSPTSGKEFSRVTFLTTYANVLHLRSYISQSLLQSFISVGPYMGKIIVCVGRVSTAVR